LLAAAQREAEQTADSSAAGPMPGQLDVPPAPALEALLDRFLVRLLNVDKLSWRGNVLKIIKLSCTVAFALSQEVVVATAADEVAEDLARWILAAYTAQWRKPAEKNAENDSEDEDDAARPNGNRPSAGVVVQHLVFRLLQVVAPPAGGAGGAMADVGTVSEVRPAYVGPRRTGLAKAAVATPAARRQRLARVLGLICRSTEYGGVVCLLELLRHVVTPTFKTS